MFGIRFHGRGGQGAVVASKILANAYFKQGLYVQAFPSFGMERKGAAVSAFVRLDMSLSSNAEKSSIPMRSSCWILSAPQGGCCARRHAGGADSVQSQKF